MENTLFGFSLKSTSRIIEDFFLNYDNDIIYKIPKQL